MEAKKTDKQVIIFWTVLAVLLIELFLLGLFKATERRSRIIDDEEFVSVQAVAAEPPPGILPPQEYGLIQPDPPRKSALSEEEQELVESLLGDKQNPPGGLVLNTMPSPQPPPPPPPPKEKNFEPQFITKALIASCGGRLCVRVDTSEPARGQDKDFYIIREP